MASVVVGVVKEEGDEMLVNGGLQCGVTEEWRDSIDSKVTETHSMLNTLVNHTSHLTKLTTIADKVTIIEDRLLIAATGKDHIETKTVYMLLKIFGSVIVGLTFVIVFLLTGVHFGWISQLHQ